MSLDNIPEPSIARGAPLGPPPGHIAYSGTGEAPVSLVARTPPPNAQPAIQDGRKRRVIGLVPAAPGSMHAMLVRAAPKANVSKTDLSTARADLRRARKAMAAAEATFISTAPTQGQGPSEEHKKATTAARDANDLVAALVRKLADLEASAVTRPERIDYLRAREPSEVADEIANGDAIFVCMHEECRREHAEGWPDEASMRRAPEHAVDKMTRRQECHVFALRCDAPLDPLDPEGERIGYVAPRGSDGTTVERAMAPDEPAATAEEVQDLRATVAKLEALVAELASKGTKKP